LRRSHAQASLPLSPIRRTETLFSSASASRTSGSAVVAIARPVDPPESSVSGWLPSTGETVAPIGTSPADADSANATAPSGRNRPVSEAPVGTHGERPEKCLQKARWVLPY
jgi:hypothetical protein